MNEAELKAFILLLSAFCLLLSSFVSICLDEHLRVGLVDPAVAALARLKVDDRFEEIAAAKIGPEDFGDVDLRVGDLPEQEVRDAQLAAGADEEIGVVEVGGVEMIGEELLVDL